MRTKDDGGEDDGDDDEGGKDDSDYYDLSCSQPLIENVRGAALRRHTGSIPLVSAAEALEPVLAFAEILPLRVNK